MLIQPVTNQIITNKIQNNRNLRTEKKELSAEQTMTALPSFADAKSFVNISFKAKIYDCAEKGDWVGIKRELNNGVDINLRDEYDWTALMNAAWKGYTDIVKELLKHPDIDLNIKNIEHGSTALILASNHNNYEAVKELLRHPDIDVNAKDIYGNTALIRAIRKNYQVVVKELLKHPDVDVNIKDNDGKTALDYANEEIRDMIQNYVRGRDKREGILTGKIDIKKLTSFDEIWTDEEKQNLSKLIKEKDFNSIIKLLESKESELNEKYRSLIADTDKLREQIKKEIRTSVTEKIQEEENAKVQKAIQYKIAELGAEKAKAQKAFLDKKTECEEKSEALDNIMNNYQEILTEAIAAERETLESGFRTLYGIKLQELPENMNFGEQMGYVTNVLLSRQNKLTGTDRDIPEKITKALQDSNGRISTDGLKFLERVIDMNNGKCSAKDITDAIEAVKNNYGLIDTGAVALFISSLSWAGNTIRSATEKVGKYCINVKK